MNKGILTIIGILVILGIVFAVFKYETIEEQGNNIDTTPVAHECNADAKICPDGSSVGRIGGDCQFAACPDPAAKSALLHTSMGQKATGLNVSVTPKELISDSRCPTDVTCIWAGTVEVRAVTEGWVSHGENNFKLNEPEVFGEYLITLTEVTPAPTSGQKIEDSTYRFTFEVKNK